MSSDGDISNKKIYYDETEDESEYDDDTRSSMSADSENYMEDFDNKSETSPDIMEELDDDMLFKMSDENDVISNGDNKSSILKDEPETVKDDEPETVKDDEPETVKEDDEHNDNTDILEELPNNSEKETIINSSLMMQYQIDKDGELSMPFGIYKECKSDDGNSVCIQTELSNNDKIENIIEEKLPEAETNVKDEKDNDNDDRIDKKDIMVLSEIIEDMKKSDGIDKKSEDGEIDKISEIIEDMNKSDEIHEGNIVTKKKMKGTKKNSYKRFNYTKKKNVKNGKKKSRNKRRILSKKFTRRNS